ncbi:MAG TPA: alpha-amylase/4-alpha-glucanotransferase domain-containing protein, partial [Gemmatimonadales bacterium]|nr:alpha-amylase/4-alpha-glucanotransferase domain-containing protein [Gemmatimonadales bacterium]
PRALFVDRVLPSGLGLAQFVAGDYRPVRSWAQVPCRVSTDPGAERVTIVCAFPSTGVATVLEKRVAFAPDGRVTVSYRWDRSVGDPDDVFAAELSLFAPLEMQAEPVADVWTFPIETVAKSERGLDHTRQGESVTLRWPVQLGEATVGLFPASSLRSTSSTPGGHAPLQRQEK